MRVETAEEKERWLSPVEARFAALVPHLDHRAVISYPFQGDHITLKEALTYKTLAIAVSSHPEGMNT